MSFRLCPVFVNKLKVKSSAGVSRRLEPEWEGTLAGDLTCLDHGKANTNFAFIVDLPNFDSSLANRSYQSSSITPGQRVTMESRNTSYCVQSEGN